MMKDARMIVVNAVCQIDSTEFTSEDVWELVKDRIAYGTVNVHLRMMEQVGEIEHVGYKQDGKAHLKLYVKCAAKSPPLEARIAKACDKVLSDEDALAEMEASKRCK